MGTCMGVVYFLMHILHVMWIRLNRFLAGSKLPENAHGVLIIGDSLAEGIGDYITLGQVPGLARHLQQAIRTCPKIRRPKFWVVRSAGVAGSTSTSWLPPGAQRAPVLSGGGASSSLSSSSAGAASSATAGTAGGGGGGGGGDGGRNGSSTSASGKGGDKNQTKPESHNGEKKTTTRKKGGDKDNKDDAGFRMGQLWDAALGPKGRFRHANIVVVCVGSNDYKHDDSRDPDVTRHNLSRICSALVAMEKKVFVVGLRRVMHVKDSVNLHRNTLVRDYCNMAESVQVDLHYGPNLHVGSWEHAHLTTADRQNFNSAGYELLVRDCGHSPVCCTDDYAGHLTR
jgi:hypothetical protein